jgi:cytokinin riboside 5'-monophosphate phosphoribohydrolase
MPPLLCVYCASSLDLAPPHYATGAALGQALAAHGWGLIYGGGKSGVMGAVALAAKAAGAPVVGVIPDFMVARELAYREADELIVVPTMRERRRLMEERATAFVTLPGGIGTLEEFVEILVSRALNRHAKPLVLVNQAGYYDDLLRFLARMVAEKFKSPGLHDLFVTVPDIAAIWPHLAHPRAPQVDALWR